MGCAWQRASRGLQGEPRCPWSAARPAHLPPALQLLVLPAEGFQDAQPCVWLGHRLRELLLQDARGSLRASHGSLSSLEGRQQPLHIRRKGLVTPKWQRWAQWPCSNKHGHLEELRGQPQTCPPGTSLPPDSLPWGGWAMLPCLPRLLLPAAHIRPSAQFCLEASRGFDDGLKPPTPTQACPHPA